MLKGHKIKQITDQVNGKLLNERKVSVIATLIALNPVITIGLAYLILKESITLKEGAGMLFAFIAIILFTV
jgi:drug/metabolite transporter (DMT)-like permease